MKTFDNIYDFYDLDDEEAAKFVSTFISEKGPVYKKKQYPDRLYFVIHLENKWENYGKSCGLLSISNVCNSNFAISMFTPDDGDLSLYFNGDNNELNKIKKKVISYLNSMCFENTSYLEVIKLIQEEVKSGTIEY